MAQDITPSFVVDSENSIELTIEDKNVPSFFNNTAVSLSPTIKSIIDTGGVVGPKKSMLGPGFFMFISNI